MRGRHAAPSRRLFGSKAGVEEELRAVPRQVGSAGGAGALNVRTGQEQGSYPYGAPVGDQLSQRRELNSFVQSLLTSEDSPQATPVSSGASSRQPVRALSQTAPQPQTSPQPQVSVRPASSRQSGARIGAGSRSGSAFNVLGDQDSNAVMGVTLADGQGPAMQPERLVDAQVLSAVSPMPAQVPDEASPEEENEQISARQLAERMQIPYVNLNEYQVDASVVQLVPEQMCRHDRLVPIGRMGGRLMVAMADPSDVVAVDDVATQTGLDVLPMAAEADAITETINRYHRVDTELRELSNSIASAAQESSGISGLPDEDVADSDDEAPIIRFVNLLISQAIMDHASDIHIEPRREGLTVRYRIDGVLHEVQHASRTMIAGVISRLKIMASMDIAERRKPQDGRISVTQAGRSVDLRVATLPTVWGEKVVMRILDSAGSHISINDLNMSGHNLEMFRTSFTKPHGMVLVTGPTGSGKSTTLYSVVAEVAKPEVNVITVEDPVEFRMDGVNQVQVNVKAGLTFASALRSILRSDPDIVLIGEIRDRETAQIAIEASLTGHLVLSTLHTNDAPSAVMRLVEMGVEPFLVGSALECVVAQRLARRLCTNCREEYVPSSQDLASMRFPLAPGAQPPTFWRAKGCRKCSNTGYSGRIAIHEVMQVDAEIERLAVADATSNDIQASALRQGMVSLRDDGWSKAAQGLTTVDEVLRVTA